MQEEKVKQSKVQLADPLMIPKGLPLKVRFIFSRELLEPNTNNSWGVSATLVKQIYAQSQQSLLQSLRYLG